MEVVHLKENRDSYLSHVSWHLFTLVPVDTPFWGGRIRPEISLDVGLHMRRFYC